MGVHYFEKARFARDLQLTHVAHFLSMEDQDSDPESPSDTTAAQDDDLVQSDDSDQGELVKKTKRRKKEPENVTSPGIIYLSRIPPFMKPHKVRHLLSRYGGVGRIYLQPEGNALVTIH